jgi:DNA end-binding protein Ku
MPRALWKGFLRLSLVTIAVEIYNAVEAGADIGFNMIHKPTGKRVNYTKTVGGEPVENSDIVKGYPIERDTYVTFTAEELDAVRLETKKTLDLSEFVDASQIDPRYFERPYYIAPADEFAGEGYLVIREALIRMGKVGIGQVTMSGREHLVAVEPIGKGLGMQILRYADEVRKADPFFEKVPAIKLDEEMVALATQLIGQKAADEWRPEKYRNHYVDAVRELIKEKAKGHTIVTAEEPAAPRGTVINLMDALKKSIQSGKPEPAKAPAGAKGTQPAAKKKAGTRR